jgi:hypothetical protein
MEISGKSVAHADNLSRERAAASSYEQFLDGPAAVHQLNWAPDRCVQNLMRIHT